MATKSALTTAATSSDQEALKALVFQRLHPKAYLERFLAEKARPDGREPHEWRDVSVNVGSISTADGSALVRLGDTTVVCGVKAEIAEPELDRPEHGFLVPNLDLPAICSPKFRPGPPSDEAQVLSDRLNEILVGAGVVPTTSLCIEPRKAVWTLYVDATCINYDGNAFDATLIAMVAALKNTRLPQAKYDEDTGRTICTRKAKVPLQISRLPVSMTFGIFDGFVVTPFACYDLRSATTSAHVLADPTAFEEPLLDTTFTITLDENGGLVSVTQIGLATSDVLQQCINTAKARCAGLSQRIYST